MQAEALNNFTNAVSVIITPSCSCNGLLVAQIFLIESLSCTTKITSVIERADQFLMK